MNLILFDPQHIAHFHPITLTRPLASVKFGLNSIAEKWKIALPNANVSVLTQPYLSGKYPAVFAEQNIYISGCVLPSKQALEAIQSGKDLCFQQHTVLLHQAKKFELHELYAHLKSENVIELTDAKPLMHIWELFTRAHEAIEFDITQQNINLNSNLSAWKERGNSFIGNAFNIHPSAKITASVLNAESGPIIIEEGAEVMEGCLIRGPFVLGKGSTLKMGAKIYGPTVIGPYCKIGGEVSNSVVLGYSNKGHDGFIGNTVLGEWCNLGADTNTSNLKNNYAKVSVYNYHHRAIEKTEQQFIGTLMGDHSKTGINTMLNTGTVVGAFANIFDSGFPPKYVPSFSWGGAQGFELFQFDKAVEVAQRMMERRGLTLGNDDLSIMQHLFNQEKTRY